MGIAQTRTNEFSCDVTGCTELETNTTGNLPDGWQTVTTGGVTETKVRCNTHANDDWKE